MHDPKFESWSDRLKRDCYIRKCPICGGDIEIEDIDYNFKGNQDEDAYCHHCHVALTTKVRYGTPIKTIVSDIDSGKYIKTIKHYKVE